MTRRRQVVGSGVGAMVVGRALAQAARRLPRIAILANLVAADDLSGADPRDAAYRALIHALRDLGYVDGQTVQIERATAEGELERVPALLRGLVAGGPDVLIVSGAPSVAAAREITRTVPIVGITGVEGHVQSLSRPGGNVTGLSNSAGPGLFVKRLELLKEAVPGATHIAVLRTPPQKGRRAWTGSIEAAARRLGVVLSVAAAERTRDLDAAFASMTRGRPHALLCADHLVYYGARRRIAAFALRERLPSMYAERQYAVAGGLLAYGATFADLFVRAAAYVDRILKGTRPADLPVEQPARLELSINVGTARALGLEMPPALRLRADTLIE